MDWMSTIPPMPITSPATYTIPTTLAVVLYVFIYSSLLGLLMAEFSSASFLFSSREHGCVSFRPPMERQRGGVEVAGPGLEGRQVAVLRLHAASAGHATKAAYSCLRAVYVRQGTKYERAPRKRPNFRDSPECELRSDGVLRSR